MERLHFGAASRYDALETAIHLSRYLIVRKLCQKRRVLDIACGEGYGSYLMSKWGAAFVDGVDISQGAIDKANKFFSTPNVRYHCLAGEQVREIAGDQKYDLIVSFETIEHVEDPHIFLKAVKSVATEDAAIVISCPNDHWMYRNGGENIFHKRRFTFDEFKTLTEEVLGTARAWHFGTLGIGFAVFSEDTSLPTGSSTDGQEMMLSYRDVDAAIFAPTQVESVANPDEVSFYVGTWGISEIQELLFSGYPVSMELGRQALFPQNGTWAVKRNPSQEQDAIDEKAELELELQRVRLLHRAAVSENELLLPAVQQKAELELELQRVRLLHRAAVSENELLLRAVQQKETLLRSIP